VNTAQNLLLLFQRLLSANEVLTHETVIKELFDEHATSLFIRVSTI
jgi:hypothetical protein